MAMFRVGLVCAVLASGGAVYAQNGCQSPYLSGWYGLPVLDSPIYRDVPVPHFALYPPVYYSLPIARTYGYSPFAYPPGVMTPEVSLPQEVNVLGTHGQPKKELPKPPRLTAAPLRLVNPFVAQPEEPSDSTTPQFAGALAPRPLVLYPSATKQARR
jgi:hypothetical protein